MENPSFSNIQTFLHLRLVLRFSPSAADPPHPSRRRPAIPPHFSRHCPTTPPHSSHRRPTLHRTPVPPPQCNSSSSHSYSSLLLLPATAITAIEDQASSSMVGPPCFTSGD
ncbi:unnamed protein product [Cuscuta europaea]|uniref:Uncharacterized protein n=1 Tax=Cuscuta europaea TaxID=41803 RepID=A0A9P0ZBY6_CUSEU|nr:unnamed protein product [Cuscuta europaea]